MLDDKSYFTKWTLEGKVNLECNGWKPISENTIRKPYVTHTVVDIKWLCIILHELFVKKCSWQREESSNIINKKPAFCGHTEKSK